MVRNRRSTALVALATAVVAAATAATLSSAAQAQPRPSDPFPYFVSPSGQPFRAGSALPPPIEQWFIQADADHDNALTRAEFLADAMRFFNIVDQNRDGVINGPENTRYETRIAPELSQGGPPAFPVTPPSPDGTSRRNTEPRPLDGAARFSFFNEPQPIRVADLNLDWQVSMAEWETATQRRFTQLDTDRDGTLTLATLPPVPDPRRPRRR